MNNKRVQPNYLLKNGDFISHITHRHEPFVYSDAIAVVYEDPEYIVVNKPASIPCHPCGGFRYNSLQYILAKENNIPNTFIVHRLDRQTSGIVLLAKNSKKASELTKTIELGVVSKFYVAKTKGKFPDTDEFVSRMIKNLPGIPNP